MEVLSLGECHEVNLLLLVVLRLLDLVLELFHLVLES